LKPLLETLRGAVLPVKPVWLMRQAGRYLPEYRAIRETAGGFLAMCLNPDLAAEITLQPVRRFGMDGAILFSDILIVPYALGQALDYREGEGPVLEPIRDAAAVDRLSFASAAERFQPVCRTVAQVRADLPPACTLIGFAGGPWTVAAYMIEGQAGSKSEFMAARRLMLRDSATFNRLIDLVTETTIAYLLAQIEAGAEALQIFDSWAGLLSAELFAAYVTAPTRRIVEAVKARYPNVPIIGFPRLGGLNYPAYAAASGVDALGLDTTVPMAFALDCQLPTQGNLDPALLLEGGEVLKNAVRRLCESVQGKPHIINLGHGVLPPTNPDHVAQLVDTIRET
jgi:uroporphyrinogen decarboxylase